MAGIAVRPGRLLYTAHRYEEAISRLEEAVARYPDSPRALQSQYLIADGFRKIALAIEESLSQILVENTRTARSKEIRQSQAMAVARFEEIQAAPLGQRQEVGELTAMEKVILRNSQFAVGRIAVRFGAAMKSRSGPSRRLVANRPATRPKPWKPIGR